MSRETIGANLRRTRQTRGWTQKSAAEAAGLSLAGYRNIETGAAEPRAATLTRLAEGLGVPLRDLLRPVRELHAVRFRSFKSLKTRRKILADVACWLDDFQRLEGLLGDHKPYRLDGPAFSGLDASYPAEAAEQVRSAFGLREDEPVRDICGLMESNGVKILTLPLASDAFFGLSVAQAGGGPAVVVNTWDRISVERWIFTAVHELAHLVLHLADYDVGERKEGKETERQANVFAGHFLMPEGVFRREWNDTYGMAFVDRVLKVKRIFRVSYKTVLYRLSTDTEAKAEIWRDFQVAYKRRFGRSLLKRDEPKALAADAFRASSPEYSRASEPEKLSPADFVEDRLSRLVRRGVEDGVVSLSRAAEILRLSLLEMRELSASWVG